jgi:hypothetical protein
MITRRPWVSLQDDLLRAWMRLHWHRLLDRIAPIDEVHP